MAWLIATSIRDKFSTGTSEVICSSKLEMAGMSGGSFNTVLDLMETYGISWFLFGDSGTHSTNKTLRSWTERVFGYRHHPSLGTLTTSFVAPSNATIVNRSSQLNPQLYGPSFSYAEYMPASNLFSAMLIHLVTKLFILLLALPPMRALFRKLSFAPGSGSDREHSREVESVEFVAIGKADGSEDRGTKAMFRYQGALVDISAILAVEAAGVLLERWNNGDKVERRGGKWKGEGGYLTPSCLGMEFVERLGNFGVEIDAEVFGE